MAKSTAEENSDRKRISIPKADESSLAWWASQKDPALSVRLLIRNEIERNGFTDTAYRPVTQLPRRGRPPGTGDSFEELDDTTRVAGAVSTANQDALVSEPVSVPVAVQVPITQPVVREPVAAGGFSSIDALMNG